MRFTKRNALLVLILILLSVFTIPKGVKKDLAGPVSQVTLSSTIEPVYSGPASQSASLAVVKRIVDGDTIVASIDGNDQKIRLLGIDSPETVDPRKSVQCFGKEASEKLKSLLSDKKVRLEDDPTQGDKDKYKRLLRYVFLENGSFVNLEMIEGGYAYEYTYDLPYRYQKQFKQAEITAREKENGLWSKDSCSGKK